MKTTKTLIALAVGLCSLNAYAADSESLTQQIETLTQRIQQLEESDSSATAAFPNGSMKIYGTFRTKFAMNEKGHGDADDSWDVSDNSSRMGLIAKTDFGHGWEAIAQGEWHVKLGGDGSFGTKARKAYAGITSPYGQVAIGKQRSAQYLIVAEYTNIFNHNGAPFAYDEEGLFHTGNLLTWRGKTGDFEWMLDTQFDETDDGANIINAAVGYDFGKMHLGIGYIKQDLLEGGDNLGKQDTLGGVISYTFSNDIYLAAAYHAKEYNYDLGGKGRSGGALDTGLVVPFGDGFNFLTGYFQFKDGIDTVESKNYTGYNVSLEYFIAKNGKVFVEYLTYDHENMAEDQIFSVGFRYDFKYFWDK